MKSLRQSLHDSVGVSGIDAFLGLDDERPDSRQKWHWRTQKEHIVS